MCLRSGSLGVVASKYCVNNAGIFQIFESSVRGEPLDRPGVVRTSETRASFHIRYVSVACRMRSCGEVDCFSWSSRSFVSMPMPLMDSSALASDASIPPCSINELTCFTV